ncbi:PLP-dependent aminotransferase family protein [Tardiphaga alba]|uniref:PLP-dependent aminotransferase family protein n=2 Tax=Tardiphaga alba TaxID=340268 RepID=A0ABX8AF41_9BRAD|nr:PLP-dependent aminotransferase family protein [Tardiphaga alba]
MDDIPVGLASLDLKPAAGTTLTRQLYDELRARILNGALPRGLRLPSSRDLALRLRVSRNTISLVIDQLAMEGYLNIARGRRPTVAEVPATTLATGQSVRQTRIRPLRLSRWADRTRKTDWPFPIEGPPRPLATVLADARLFPHDLWGRYLRRAARRPLTRLPTINRAPLREALLRHLVAHRGVKAEARQIIIMPSAQASLELIARMLVNAGDIGWVESPGYGGARAALEATDATARGITLDDGGIALKGRRDRPRLIFVTPSHQHPTGRLMPVSRRQELLAFTDDTGCALVEDDYDSEFHYDGRPVAALQGLDRNGRVFYVGTFAKSMFADIRSGYAIVPPDLVAVFETAQRRSGQIVPAPVQDALTGFIDDGHFAAHIRRMTRIYHGRRDHLVQALRLHAGDHLTVERPAGGMQLLAHLAPHWDDRDVVARLAHAGVTARALSQHFTGPVTGKGLFLGFAAWNEQEIDKAAAVIGDVLQSMHAPKALRRSGKAVPASGPRQPRPSLSGPKA